MSGPTITIPRDTYELLLHVAQDAVDLLSCNCSYDAGTVPADRCDGTCTHGMAATALLTLALHEPTRS